MALPSIIPSNLPIPLSPSSPSLLPVFPSTTRSHPRRLTSFTRKVSKQETPEAEPPRTTVEASNKTKIQKKTKKLRPSFYDQTLERWSVDNRSQRSRFPWEEEKTTEVKKKEEEPFQSPVVSFNPPISVPKGNRLVSAPWAHGPRMRTAHLGSEPELKDSMSGSEFGEESVKSRLGLIVEKMDSSLGFRSSDFDGNHPVTENVGIGLGIREKTAPLLRGAEPKEAILDSQYEAKVKLEEYFEFDGEDENETDSFGRNGSHCSTDERNSENQSVSITETSDIRFGTDLLDTIKSLHPDVTTRFPLYSLEFDEESGGSGISVIANQSKNTFGNSSKLDADFSGDEYEDDCESESDIDIGKKSVGSVALPWERDDGDSDGGRLRRCSNTEVAERTIPEPELKRLRNVALRMKERVKVGPAGVTESVVQHIHKKWKEDEVVKLRFEGPASLNMKRTHEILERKTGGLVIWRAGSSLVLYRGMTYELPCVQTYSELADTASNNSTTDIVGNTMNNLHWVSKGSVVNFTSSFLNQPQESVDAFDIDSLLDQLGPRYRDWSGCNPLPIDADLLPGVVAGYKPPFRFLPHKTRISLRNSEMTNLRRLARSMSPHFALGRNRQHQGLASAMVKLWEKTAIAKIAIKRGVPNTCNERMAEEIKKLTGGLLVSRNKEYIVFYRGNDYVTPSIREALVEKQKMAIDHQDEEEAARLRASSVIVSKARTASTHLVAGTLAETVEANMRWGNQPTSEDREKMKRDLTLAKHASVVRYLERKLAFAKARVKKAEKALAKVQEFLNPAELPTDLETVTDEERFLFRKIGLKMKAFLLLGRRGVFDGTVENMHLNWKHRELVKIYVKGKSFAQVKHIAISLEAESGGVLISLDKTTKGYAVIVYRGKNYHRPHNLKPKNLLTRRQALARSIELQRREALNYHIADLQEKIKLLKSQLDQMEADKDFGNENLNLMVDGALPSDDEVEVEDEGEEAYLPTYSGPHEDDDYPSAVDF